MKKGICKGPEKDGTYLKQSCFRIILEEVKL